MQKRGEMVLGSKTRRTPTEKRLNFSQIEIIGERAQVCNVLHSVSVLRKQHYKLKTSNKFISTENRKYYQQICYVL